MARRDDLQEVVLRWVQHTFGAELLAPQERVARLLEEVVELAQAEDFPEERALALVRHVYLKPPGSPLQEVGGVGVTLLAYCGSKGISADTAERMELDRVLSLPAEHFRRRQAAKANAGVAAEPTATD